MDTFILIAIGWIVILALTKRASSPIDEGPSENDMYECNRLGPDEPLGPFKDHLN